MKVKKAGVFVDIGGGSTEVPASGWVRPDDWLDMPTLTVGQQKFVGLYAIHQDSPNWATIHAAAAYTVDWGDGVVENFNANIVAHHAYSFAATSSATQTSKGFRQVLITVTPQGAGNLTMLNLTSRPTHLAALSVANTVSAWLDCVGVGPNIVTLSPSASSTASTWRPRAMRRFRWIGPLPGLVSGANIFNGCTSLMEVEMDTSAMSTISNMFNGCTSLLRGPSLNFSAAQTADAVFSGCAALVSTPAYNLSAAFNVASFFSACSCLEDVGLITLGVCSVQSMFTQCQSLRTIPAIDMIGVNTSANLSGLVSGCANLSKFDVRNIRFPFTLGPASLVAAELNRVYTNLYATTNLLPASAASVESGVADWNVNNVNATIAMGASGIDGAQTLLMTSPAAGESSTRLTTRVAVTAGQTYTGLATSNTASRTRRVRLAWYDVGGALISESSSVDSTAVGQRSVTAVAPVGAVTASLVISWASTGAAQTMNWDMMGILPGTDTVWNRAGQTVTVTGNPGISGDDPSIATAKGWVVVGS